MWNGIEGLRHRVSTFFHRNRGNRELVKRNKIYTGKSKRVNRHMATLAGHLSAFIFLFPTGIRRLLCSSSLYLENPSQYRSKTWYFSEPRWKNFDLYALILALPVASFSEFFIFLSFTGNPTYKFAFFQKSVVIFLFWVLILLIIFRENVDPLRINEGFIFVFVGVSFLVEYTVIGKGITGLGGTVYDLLGALTLISAGCCFYLSIRPWSFFAEFLLSSGLIFKGTWVLQTGLSLYTDSFGLKGCHKISVPPATGDNDLRCDLEDDGLRGVALMKLIFIGHAIVVLVLSFVLFGLLSRNWKSRHGEAGGPLLAELDSQTVIMRASSELELE